ncbi:DUF1062 domain-containing protein [uncultured Bosea sp.]|uniref:DUF1062 domain-containing protein n=1 Tax=uncultured Bosea sp. TaxID=211457 RepID=UPI0025CD0995|nr:DUF1062 domain-containing protein [uncultured Bosea sp.]
MCAKLRVRWTVTPQIPPQPWLSCNGCGGPRAFRASGKARLNANGRSLDAWLIYRCVGCDKTWNRPVFERRNIRDIEPRILAALQSNDPLWVQTEAFNLDALRRKAQRIDEFPEYDIVKDILSEARDWTHLEIELMVPFPASLRLDRLLASELGLSRARLQVLHDEGALCIASGHADSLRRRVRTGAIVLLDLSAETGREELWRPLAADIG